MPARVPWLPLTGCRARTQEINAVKSFKNEQRKQKEPPDLQTSHQTHVVLYQRLSL